MIWKSHHATQTAEAKKDYRLITILAKERNRPDLTDKYPIEADWGWRRIDKQLAKIREGLNLTIEDFLEIKKERAFEPNAFENLFREIENGSFLEKFTETSGERLLPARVLVKTASKN